MATVVDVHCHAFNADDLPVQGFLRRVVFRNADLAAAVAVLLDRLVQGGAPGYGAEMPRLDALLGRRAAVGLESLSASQELPDLDTAVELSLTELSDTDPALVQELDALMPTAPQGQEALLSLTGGAARAVRWALLLGSYRMDVAARMIETFDVDLFTPMLVDLGLGVNDKEAASARQQIELHEKVSRLSMLERLPGDTGHARLHPFLGFDPRRQVRSKRNGDIETALELVQLAIEKYGFVGVKLYPPMGFRPIGNEKTTLDRVTAMTTDDAAEVDEALRELYRYCAANDVPITAHCNHSNGAHESYFGYSDPGAWAKVVEEFPSLHVNLGHFGGASEWRDKDRQERNDWPDRIAAIAAENNYVYADVGNHRIDDDRVARAYLARVQSIFAEQPVMQQRLMYGSDWSMLALLPQTAQFRQHYEDLYREHFGDEATERFLGGAALEFLGFSDEGDAGTERPENKNRRRLLDRYTRHSAPVPEWLRAQRVVLPDAGVSTG